MTRTILAAVGLIGLAACGRGSHHATKTKAATPRTATRETRATSQKHKAATRRDTTTQRNPLTNR